MNQTGFFCVVTERSLRPVQATKVEELDDEPVEVGDVGFEDGVVFV
jgi:hypothetical protein